MNNLFQNVFNSVFLKFFNLIKPLFVIFVFKLPNLSCKL